MTSLLDDIEAWLRELLSSGILNNLSGIFDSVNDEVGEIAGQVATSPSAFSPGIFSMIRNVSESVVLPVAGLVLTFIACYELIQMIIDHNNLNSFETWIFFKWTLKTFVAVTLISNCFDITMAVFDVSQSIINSSSSVITGSTSIDADFLGTLEASLEDMELGAMVGLFLQSMLLQFVFKILSKLIFIIVMGRMLEIYLMISLAPIPFSTFGNREQSQIGQNYLRSLFALGLQGFLIMICVGIYAVLIQSISLSDDPIQAIWRVFGYTILLCFALFKTGALAKSILSAH